MLTMALANMLYAQPPETPNIPSEHGTLGLLPYVIPNTEGNLIELENTTDCEMEFFAYITIVTDQSNSVETYTVNATVSAGGSININWTELTNQINILYNGQNFAITHWSYNVRIGTWVMPIYPGEDKTISTSLPPPCDCIRLQFLINCNPRGVKASPGTGC